MSSLTREAELALLIAEQEADDRYGDSFGSGWSRRVSLDASLTDDGFTLAEVLGEEDAELTALIEEERTAIRLVHDDRVTERDIASWRWARHRRKWTYKQIASHFGVTEAVVYYHLKKPQRLPRCPHITKRGRHCRREVIVGETACVVHARHTPAKWTRQRVILAVNDWRQLTGSFPSTRDWARATAEHPTFKTVYDLFGSWQAALDEAASAAIEDAA